MGDFILVCVLLFGPICHGCCFAHRLAFTYYYVLWYAKRKFLRRSIPFCDPCTQFSSHFLSFFSPYYKHQYDVVFVFIFFYKHRWVSLFFYFDVTTSTKSRVIFCIFILASKVSYCLHGFNILQLQKKKKKVKSSQIYFWSSIVWSYGQLSWWFLFHFLECFSWLHFWYSRKMHKIIIFWLHKTKS